MDSLALLSQTPLFAGLAPETLARLAALSRQLDVPSGSRVFAAGEMPTHFYVVASGRLRVQSGERLVGYTGRFEPVGEVGLLAGEPRSADVHAIRDSVVLQIERTPFLQFLEEHPTALMALTRLMIGRLRQNQKQQRQAWSGGERAFAVIPAAPGLPVMALAEALVRRLGGWPQARLVGARHIDAALGAGLAQTPFESADDNARLMGGLNELEARHRYLVYASESHCDAWATRCMRQADRVLVLAEASAKPSRLPVLDLARERGLMAPVELVLLRAHCDPSPHTLEWRRVAGARSHYFLHPWHEPELAALTRQVTGRGIGLVLGGGGARGFAHIGLLRALEELEIPVDVTGGTSMGAFVAALVACGYDSVEMAQIARETFVKNNLLNDYVVPRVSLIRGRKFRSRLAEIFGEQSIEQLRRTYFCVTTNLSNGATVVHEDGSLASWVAGSMAVPGVAPPIAWKGELLCDGGVVDNLPTDVMQSLERGSIIACNVSMESDIRVPGIGLDGPDFDVLFRPWTGQGRRPSLAEIISRTATLTADTTGMRMAAERADHYVRMPVQGFGMFDWRRLEELVERGYEHALVQLAPLREDLAR